MGKTIRYSKDTDEGKEVKVTFKAVRPVFNMSLLSSLSSRLTTKLHKMKG